MGIPRNGLGTHEGIHIMKKHLLALFTCMAALCLVLVGCGGSGNGGSQAASSADPTPFVGTWELYEMESDGEVTSNEDVATLKDFLGISVYADIAEDGTLELDVFGEILTGTWEATGDGVASATLEGQDITLSIVDDKLVIDQSGSSMTFAQIDPSEKLDNAAALDAMQEEVENLDVDVEGLEGEIADAAEATDTAE